MLIFLCEQFKLPRCRYQIVPASINTDLIADHMSASHHLLKVMLKIIFWEHHYVVRITYFRLNVFCPPLLGFFVFASALWHFCTQRKARAAHHQTKWSSPRTEPEAWVYPEVRGSCMMPLGSFILLQQSRILRLTIKMKVKRFP